MGGAGRELLGSQSLDVAGVTRSETILAEAGCDVKHSFALLFSGCNLTISTKTVTSIRVAARGAVNQATVYHVERAVDLLSGRGFVRHGRPIPLKLSGIPTKSMRVYVIVYIADMGTHEFTCLTQPTYYFVRFIKF